MSILSFYDMQRDKDPLSPLAGWTYLLLAALGLAVLCGVSWSITGSGSIMGFGNVGSICVDELTGGTADFGRRPPPHDLRAGVEISTVGYSYCSSAPDAAQRIWYTLTMLPTTLLFAAVLLILFRLVRGAARDGIHTSGTARRLRVLGWVLIAGAVLAPQAQELAKTRLLATMVKDQLGGYFIAGGSPYGPLLSLVLVGVGLLTFARFVLVGTEMRADLDGTV